MAQYLHKFGTESAFNAAYNGNDYHEPWVSYTDETEGQEHVDYNKRPPYIYQLWEELGNTAPIPEKVMIFDNNNPDVYTQNSIADAVEYDWNATGTSQNYNWPHVILVDDPYSWVRVTIKDSTALTESDFDLPDTARRDIYFMWEIENDPNDDLEIGYNEKTRWVHQYEEIYWGYPTNEYKVALHDGKLYLMIFSTE